MELKWSICRSNCKKNLRKNVDLRRSLDKYMFFFKVLVLCRLIYLFIKISFYKNTAMSNEISELERQRISIEERKQMLRKFEQDKLKEQ